MRLGIIHLINIFLILSLSLVETVHSESFTPKKKTINPWTHKLQWIYPTLDSLENVDDGIVSPGNALKFLKVNAAGDSITADTAATGDFTLTTQTGIDGTTTIPLTSLYINVESDGGDVTVTANPRIASATISGQRLVLEGTSDIDKLIFEDGNGLSMSTSVTVGDGDILAFIWNNIKELWIMLYSDTK